MSQVPQSEQICQRMAALRSEMDEDVDEIVDNARTMADWRYYVKTYPWVCLGAAAVAGYLLVPQRVELVSPDPETMMQLAKKNRVLVKPKPESQPRGVGGTLLHLLAQTAIRAGVGIMAHKAGQMLDGLPDGVPDGAEGPSSSA